MVAVHVADEDALELLKTPLVVAECELHPLSCIDQERVSVNVQKRDVVPLEGTGTAAPVPRNTTSNVITWKRAVRLVLDEYLLEGQALVVRNTQHVHAVGEITCSNHLSLLTTAFCDNLSLKADQRPSAAQRQSLNDQHVMGRVWVCIPRALHVLQPCDDFNVLDFHGTTDAVHHEDAEVPGIQPFECLSCALNESFTIVPRRRPRTLRIFDVHHQRAIGFFFVGVRDIHRGCHRAIQDLGQ